MIKQTAAYKASGINRPKREKKGQMNKKQMLVSSFNMFANLNMCIYYITVPKRLLDASNLLVKVAY